MAKKVTVKPYFHKNRLRKRDGKSILYLMVYCNPYHSYIPLFPIDPQKFDLDKGREKGRSAASVELNKKIRSAIKSTKQIVKKVQRTGISDFEIPARVRELYREIEPQNSTDSKTVIN